MRDWVSCGFRRFAAVVASVPLALLLVLGVPGVAHAEYRGFSDLDESAWYVRQGAIDFVVDGGIMSGLKTNGVPNGLFGPNDPITRGQVATILYRMAGEPSVDSSSLPFWDVGSGRFYTEAVAWAYAEGIVSGYKVDGVPTGEFGPDDGVTREQLAKMLGGFAVEAAYADVSSDCLAAKAIDGWGEVSSFAEEWIGWAVDECIMSGKKQADESYDLAPKAGATRAETAKMVMVLIGETLAPETPASDFAYEIVDDGAAVEILGYKGASSHVAIPAEIDSLPVAYVELSPFGNPSSPSGGNIVSVDCSRCPTLKVFSLSGSGFDDEGAMKLQRLNLSGCSNLESLYCSLVPLGTLNLSSCSSLKALYCLGANLGALYLSGCPLLEVAYCSYNDLTSLDLSGCSSLQRLDCSWNELTSLDVSNCPDLQYLDCSNNLIRDLSALEAWLAVGGHGGAIEQR